MTKCTVRKQEGFTLVELIVGMTIALVMLGILAGTFIFLNREYNKAWSAYDEEREIQNGVETIRRDLKEASLNSIMIYPDEMDRIPGVSMITAEYEERSAGGATKRYFKTSRYGTPQWSGHVFYTLVPSDVPSATGTAFERKIGDLVRWSLPLDEAHQNPDCPFPTDIIPSAFKENSANVRVIFRQVPMPDSPEIKEMGHFKHDSINYGGFQVGFLYQRKNEEGSIIEEFISPVNPA